jgi:16S rRNA C967 or C1407 C5-methylase (RsmB/RsmF family)/NOL1/NOP2/fmu family ribosome biogenesis protein
VKLPDLFVERMTGLLEQESTAFMESYGQPAPVSIRLNPFKRTDKFSEAAAVPWCTDGRYLENRPSFTLDPLFHAGAYYVQEASSMFIGTIVHDFMQNKRVRKVLDLCAAPGGKSTHLRSILPDDALLVSNEVVLSRNFTLGANLAKWGHPGTIISRSAPGQINGCDGFFDIVVVDAPCSGEGMFRKDKGAIEEWSPSAVESCAFRQSEIVRSATRLVAPGGLLIYSTCTWSLEEDEKIIASVLEEEPFELFPLQKFEGIVYTDKGARFYPHKIQGEGFFVAALVRNNDGPATGRKLKMPAHVNRVSSDVFSGPLYLQSTYPLLKVADSLWCLPEIYMEHWLEIVSAFHIVASGCPYGTIKGKEVQPAAELALSILLNQDFPAIRLPEAEALRFLRGETLAVDAQRKGWHLLCFDGLGLGWGKAVNGRLNNNYPKAWRIRMQLDSKSE